MNKQEYLEKKVKPIMENLMFQLVCEKPDDPVEFMINWIQKTGGYNSNGLTLKERDELENLRKEIIQYRNKHEQNNNEEDNNGNSSDEEEDETFDPKLEIKKQKIIELVEEEFQQNHMVNLIRKKILNLDSYKKQKIK